MLPRPPSTTRPDTLFPFTTPFRSIMTASSPSEALRRNETSYSSGGIKPAASVPANVRAILEANQRLMVQLGFQGTPGILFRDGNGTVQRRAGMPAPDDLATVLGPR